MQEDTSAAPRSQKRQRNHEEEFDDNPAHFRRVRLRYSDQTHEPGNSLAAQETDISPHGGLENSRNKAASTQLESVATPVQTTDAIASMSTDSASTFYADAGRTVPDFTASTSTSKSPAAKHEMSFTYFSDSEEDLRHPIGGSYMPNAQLVYSSDEESDTLVVEKPDWYQRTVFGSPPAEDDEHDRGSFFYSDSYSREDHAAPEQSLKVHSSIFSARLPHVVTSQPIDDGPEYNATQREMPLSEQWRPRNAFEKQGF